MKHFKKNTLEEIARMHEFAKSNSFEEVSWVSPKGDTIHYYIASKEVTKANARDLPCVDAVSFMFCDKDNYFLLLFPGVPRDLRNYYAWHELLDWDLAKDSDNSHPWCAETEGTILSKIEEDDMELAKKYARHRKLFFENIAEYAKSSPEHYDIDDVNNFQIAARYLHGYYLGR